MSQSEKVSETPNLPKVKPLLFAIRNPVTITMLFLTIIVFGWRSYQNLPVNLMPDISYPTLSVRTEFKGAAPEDVEKLVTRPLEEMLSAVSGMVQIRSISAPGLSEIVMQFTWNTDMTLAQQDVRDRLDLFEPPEEITEKPVILRFDPSLDPVMRVAISPGEFDGVSAEDIPEEKLQQVLTTIRENTKRHLKSDLEAESGIAQVSVKGGREAEIQILVDASQLKSLGVTLENIVQSLSQQNINLSGGQLVEGKTEYLVRTLNEFDDINAIHDSIVMTPTGEQLRLADVATINMGMKDRESIVHVNGFEAVALDIYKEGDANTVEVCNKVKDLLAFERESSIPELIAGKVDALAKWARERRAQREGTDIAADPATPGLGDLFKKRNLLDRLPENVHLNIISDQSRFITASVNEVTDGAISGGYLALLVLFLFLRELKPTLLIGVAIPISIMTCFVPMFMQDISLNVMSLGGLALAVGMLVDDSVVVLESIYRCREEGDDPVTAANRGTREVASPVISSTLTTVVVFVPMAFVEGIVGQMFGDLGLTVTFSLLASLLTSLFLVPMLSSRQGVAFREGRDVVWILRAYNESRGQGKSQIVSVIGIPVLAIRYVLVHVRTLGEETFSPAIRALRSSHDNKGIAYLINATFALLFLPLNVVLIICQLFLSTIAAIIVTVFFFITMVLYVPYTLFRQLLKITETFLYWTFEKPFEAFRDSYGFVLRRSLRFSALGIIGALIFAAHGTWLAFGLGTELMPPIKQGEFGIMMEAAAGTRLEDMAERARKIEDVIKEDSRVANVTVEIGQESESAETGRSENVAQFTIVLNDPKVNALLQDQIVEELRQKVTAVSNDNITFTLPSMFSFETAMEVQLVGDDLDTLRRIGKEALEKVRGVPGIVDPELSLKPGYPEIIIELDRELLASKGITPLQVAQRLRTEVQGDVATKLSQHGEKVDIRVRTNHDLLSSIEDLRKVSVKEGLPPVPLEAVAYIRQQEGPSEIRRIDQRQVVVIGANIEGFDMGSIAANVMEAVNTVQIPEDYYFMLGGQNRELESSFRGMYFALLLSIFLVYVVMACQFESLLEPLLVMFSVPLALIGVVYSFWFMEINVSAMVFLGGIILIGSVVNNAIVLVDYVNHLIKLGMKLEDALVHAGKVRLRPILMTTITTVLGLLPMVISTGEGSEIRRPLAVTLMSGLSVSTILTLAVIPMGYYLLYRRRTP